MKGVRGRREEGEEGGREGGRGGGRNGGVSGEALTGRLHRLFACDFKYFDCSVRAAGCYPLPVVIELNVVDHVLMARFE